MSMTDPIADFLTRIRNGIMAAHETVEIPSSTLKKELARILREQGYIESFETTEGRPGADFDRVRPGRVGDRVGVPGAVGRQVGGLLGVFAGVLGHGVTRLLRVEGSGVPTRAYV